GVPWRAVKKPCDARLGGSTVCNGASLRAAAGQGRLMGGRLDAILMQEGVSILHGCFFRNHDIIRPVARNAGASPWIATCVRMACNYAILTPLLNFSGTNTKAQ